MTLIPLVVLLVALQAPSALIAGLDRERAQREHPGSNWTTGLNARYALAVCGLTFLLLTLACTVVTAFLLAVLVSAGVFTFGLLAGPPLVRKYLLANSRLL